MWDTLYTNATLLDKNGNWQTKMAFAVTNGFFSWVGGNNELTKDQLEQSRSVIDCHDQYVTPGLIDCHTHLVYAGSRADEFRKRLSGISYAEIAAAGGGIQSTVSATRQASEDDLLKQSLVRLNALMQQGVTTVEIKSGYGLDVHNEIKMLRVAKKLGEITGVRVFKTFLGAHTIPQEYQGRADSYVELVCKEMLPQAVSEGLVDAVDVFCESIAFDARQTEKIFQCAQELGLPIKCHAEQLTDMGITQVAANYKALSCEHLEYTNETSIKAMAENNTVAVILPGAFYFLRETKKPPIDLFRQYKVPMAVATDCNPGSSPTTSILLMLNMVCTLFGLTVQEALKSVTSNAAKALGLEASIGSIKEGVHADFIVWDINEGSDLCYYIGSDFKKFVYKAGKKFDGELM